MSIYNKYRPDSFDTIIGDFSSIENMLKEPNHNRAFLFIGETGCGKTTLARIIAKEVGATEFDITEINCSDDTGVDAMRELVSNMGFTPHGKAKVYILDEMHKLSNNAQQLLLKPCEDVPNKTYIILCTSEPTKVIKALKTRPTVVDFKAIDDDDLFDLLKDIVKKENETVKGSHIEKIVAMSNGSARKALTILEPFLSANDRDDFLKNYIDTENATPELFEIAKAVYNNGTYKEIMELMKIAKESKTDGEAIRRVLLGYGASMLLNNYRKDILDIQSCFMSNVFDTGFNGVVNQVAKAYSVRKKVETVF